MTTNIKHKNQQTFEDNNENTLLTKSSAESFSIFQMNGSYRNQKIKREKQQKQTRNKKEQQICLNYFGESGNISKKQRKQTNKTNMFKLLWLIWKSKKRIWSNYFG